MPLVSVPRTFWEKIFSFPQQCSWRSWDIWGSRDGSASTNSCFSSFFSVLSLLNSLVEFKFFRLPCWMFSKWPFDVFDIWLEHRLCGTVPYFFVFTFLHLYALVLFVGTMLEAYQIKKKQIKKISKKQMINKWKKYEN